jgi:hypothetical protein
MKQEQATPANQFSARRSSARFPGAQNRLRLRGEDSGKTPPAPSNHVLLKQQPGRLQTKLVIGDANDQFEQEADRVADQIMRMPAKSHDVIAASPFGASNHALQRKCACGGIPGPSGECEACRKKRLGLQRRATDSHGPTDVPSIVHEVLRSAGRPLDAETRAFMEPRFDYDFSDVRVHFGAHAAQSARAVNARAYAVGTDLVFGAGQYTPENAAGKKLLAHELAHVVQQKGSSLSRAAAESHLWRLTDEDGEPSEPEAAELSMPSPSSTRPLDLDPAQAAQIGREALRTVGYESLIKAARQSGFLTQPSVNSGTTVHRKALPGVLRRQVGEVFVREFTRFAVTAGVVSQVDTPAPGPADLVALGILAFGLGFAIGAAIASPVRVCPPCPSPPPPDIDRVPPSRPHAPCPGDHWHYYEYNQNPTTCVCYGPYRRFGGCCLGIPGLPC